MPSPEIRYARSGDVSIAYVVTGDGPIDIVFVHGFVGNLEHGWAQPLRVAFFERLRCFGRVIEFDRRGTGLSDRVREIPTLETRMDDVRAVMDAIGSERGALVATNEAAAMAVLFAATYPERVGALVLWNPTLRGTADAEYPWAPSAQEWQRRIDEAHRSWGTDSFVEQALRRIAPTHADDPAFRSWFGGMLRTGASPGAVAAVMRMEMDVDVRDVLPSVRAPTLVAYREPEREAARFAVERIPGARELELPGPDSVFFLVDGAAEEIGEFVAAGFTVEEPETVLATLLFTDLVGSTERAAELGDRAWAELVNRHHAVVRRQLDRFRGRELDTAGDGFFAAFDGPIRAIRCAQAIVSSVRELGLEVRSGLHTGECEVVGEKLGGIAVNIGARVAARATAGEVLVTRTVKDLVAGSGLTFDERGVAELKGVPGEWRLYAVADAAA
jgi:class 3 adenylate cyclase